jgi:blue copper oxidase
MDHTDVPAMHGAVARTVVEGEFVDPLPAIPSVDGGRGGLEPQGVRVRIGSDSVDGLGYSSGGLLGPTLSLESGGMLGVTLRNRLSEGTNLHWHGLTVPAALDGFPDSVVAAGAAKSYAFPVTARAGLYWYHPHQMGSTARQAYRGLAGLIRVSDPQERAVGLPDGVDEIPLVVQDKRLAGGGFAYDPTMDEVMAGWTGERILVNGALAPVVSVRRGWARLRILNGSNARVYDLAFQDGRPFVVIGSDGGLVGTPASASEILLGPGERVDVLVDFSADAAGVLTYLRSEAFANGGTQGKQGFRIAKFVVDSAAGAQRGALPVLPDPGMPSGDRSDTTRLFELSGEGGMSMMGGMSGMHRINGKSWDPRRIDAEVVAGSTEIWVFRNPSTEIHPVHIHGLQFRILERTGGRTALAPHERGWKDTFVLLPGESARLVLTFPDQSGIFLLHCHNLEHEEDGMMLQFRIHSAPSP